MLKKQLESVDVRFYTFFTFAHLGEDLPSLIVLFLLKKRLNLLVHRGLGY